MEPEIDIAGHRDEPTSTDDALNALMADPNIPQAVKIVLLTIKDRQDRLEQATAAARNEQIEDPPIQDPIEDPIQDPLVVDESSPENAQKHTMDSFTTMGRHAVLVIVFTQLVMIAGVGNVNFMFYATVSPNVTCEEYDTFIDLCKTKIKDVKTIKNCTLKVGYEFKSVVVEFEKYCREESKVKMTKTEEFIIILTGMFFLGNFSDRYGRKKVLVISYLAISMLGLFVSFAHTPSVFLTLRRVVAFFAGGIISTFEVYRMENLPPKHRLWVASVFSWFGTSMLFSDYLKYVKNWRQLQRLIIFTSFPAFILLFFVHESPRFLIQRGHISEARRILRKMQKIDQAPDKIRENMEEWLTAKEEQRAQNPEEKDTSIYLLFSTREMIIAGLALCSGGFVYEMLALGLGVAWSFTKPTKTIDSMKISLESIAYLFCVVASILEYRYQFIGRKFIHLLSYMVIICSLCVIITYGTLHDYMIHPVAIIVAIAANDQTNIEPLQSFLIKNLSTMEFYPTVVRTKALAMRNMCRRFGVEFATEYFRFSPSNKLPILVMIAISLVDTVFFQIAVPETKGKPLPESIQEMKENQKTQKNSSRTAKMILRRML